MLQRQSGLVVRDASQPRCERQVPGAAVSPHRLRLKWLVRLHPVQDKAPQCKYAEWHSRSFPEASPENGREHKRTRHHQLTEKSSVVEQGVVDVCYA
ncbi:hypothetical protein D3C78_998430 [compost metagenome]